MPGLFQNRAELHTTGKHQHADHVSPVQTKLLFPKSTRELIPNEVAAMPEPLRREVYDLARFLRHKNEDSPFNGLLLSKSALAKDWNTPEEDATWASL